LRVLKDNADLVNSVEFNFIENMAAGLVAKNAKYA
jgi:hypothetical protein